MLLLETIWVHFPATTWWLITVTSVPEDLTTPSSGLQGFLQLVVNSCRHTKKLTIKKPLLFLGAGERVQPFKVTALAKDISSVLSTLGSS